MKLVVTLGVAAMLFGSAAVGCTKDHDHEVDTAPPAAGAETVVDPVCGMRVDPKTAHKAVHDGKTYYFCDETEKKDFEKEPEKYLKKSE